MRRRGRAGELLLEPGSPYRTLLAQETARNLRGLIQLSIVLVVPTQGRRPGTVRVLVITKDVWSLRVNWALQVINSSITSLVLNPSEENLFGSHAIVGALFVLDPATYSLGVSLALGLGEQDGAGECAKTGVANPTASTNPSNGASFFTVLLQCVLAKCVTSMIQ